MSETNVTETVGNERADEAGADATSAKSRLREFVQDNTIVSAIVVVETILWTAALAIDVAAGPTASPPDAGNIAAGLLASFAIIIGVAGLLVLSGVLAYRRLTSV